MDAIRLPAGERSRASGVLARAFLDYPLFSCFFPDRDLRSRHFTWYIGRICTYGLRYGEVYATSDLSGVAIWLPPGQTHCTLWRYVRAGFALVPVLYGVRSWLASSRIDDWMVAVHQETMPGPHWYLWMIGVDPDRQGRGAGTALLQDRFAQADAQSLPCYLETHDPANVAFYERRGFRVARREQVPGFELVTWFMARDPRRS